MKSLTFSMPEDQKSGWGVLETKLGNALKKGLAKHGVDVRLVTERIDPKEHECVGIVGVKSWKMAQACNAANTPYLYFDKAYNRDKAWWKISYGSHQPTWWIDKLAYGDDRRLAQGWDVAPWRAKNDDGHILIAGSSAKYHRFFDLLDPTEYWSDVVRQLQALTRRKILYRPKKSWHDATPLLGTEFSKVDLIKDDLAGAHAMITNGSNSCFEALTLGIPAIVLGQGFTLPISSESVGSVLDPYEAPYEDRIEILNNLAYCQWSMVEIAEGDFWQTIEDCRQLTQ